MDFLVCIAYKDGTGGRILVIEDTTLVYISLKFRIYRLESIDYLTLSEMDNIQRFGGAEMLTALNRFNAAIEPHLSCLMVCEVAASTEVATACLENFSTIFKAMNFYAELRRKQADALFADAIPANTGLNS